MLEVTDDSGKTKRLTQSLSILRYLGLRYGYYPVTDHTLAWQVDSIVDATKDTIDALAKIVWE